MLAQLVSRAFVSGTIAATAVTLVASMASRRFTGSSASAFNATSHFAWGERAGTKDEYSLKYTGIGAAANYGASIFWAMLYELIGSKGRPPTRALRDAALVAAAAYVTDYHIVPKRLTPGFELRLPGRALACIFAALALGLSARDLVLSSAARSQDLQSPAEHDPAPHAAEL